MTKPGWKTRLEPFAQQYLALYDMIHEYVSGLTDADLALVERQSHMPTQTNCGWSTYRVAPLIREEIRCERYRRERRAQCPSQDP